MDPQYWHAKWQRQDLGFNQDMPNVLLQKFLPQMKLSAGKRVFVPLCGKSVDMLYLIEQGYEVIGVELNLAACETFFHEHHFPMTQTTLPHFIKLTHSEKKITLFCGNFFDLTQEHLGQIDLVYDRAALIALPATLRAQYSRHMLTLVTQHTQMLLITTDFDQRQMSGPPFTVGDQEVRALYESYFNIRQIFNKQMHKIPEHLYTKGLQSAKEQAYWLDSQ